MEIEIIGWLGTAGVLLAYLLITSNKVTANSAVYQLLNLFGAIGIIINSSHHNAIPSVGLNVIWLLIAVYGLIQIGRKK
jgi:formate hydrogenlyase subunit 3/multisubunit Na+/H+ antiporter MnhD subunit